MVDETIKDTAAIFDKPNPLSYKEWAKRENKIGIPYVAFAFKGDAFDKHKNFIVGNGEKYDNAFSRRRKRAKNFKNGELIPGKEYAVVLRGYTTKVNIDCIYLVEITSFIFVGLIVFTSCSDCPLYYRASGKHAMCAICLLYA